MQIEIPEDFESVSIPDLQKLARQGSDLQIAALIELRDREKRGELAAREERLACLGPVGRRVSMFLESATRRVGLAAFVVTVVIILSLIGKVLPAVQAPVQRLQAAQKAAAAQVAAQAKQEAADEPQAPAQAAPRMPPPPAVFLTPEERNRDARARRDLMGDMR